MLRQRFSLLLAVLALAVFSLACASAEPRNLADGDGGTSTGQNTEGTQPIDGKPKAPNPDEASSPEVDGIAPNKATVGSVGPTVVVSGNNFVPRSIVQLDGAPLATSFVSGTELRATIPSSKLTTVGVLRLSVGTAPPGGGASKEATFTVENPSPHLTALAPLSVLAGASGTPFEVNGSAFVPGAKIVFGTTPLATSFASSTLLKATIPAGLLTTSGSIPVTVDNPAPGGGASTPIAFTVSNPSAGVQFINPVASFVGSAPFELTVDGAGFVGGSTVLFNGTVLKTTFVHGGKLKAQVLSSSLGVAGDFPVAVKNPPPGGGVSAPVVFRLQYPVPVASSLDPSSVGSGSGPTTVTVTGVGFSSMTQITFDNAPAATTFIDATHVKATLTAAQLASAGAISVRVVNPAPGGGASTALAFTMMNGVPTITSLNPSTVVSGAPDTFITVYGSGFINGSSVTSNGQVLQTFYVSGGQIGATVPANHLLTFGSASIAVTNPAPGGGKSSSMPLSVGCDTSNVNVYLSALGTTYSLATNFGTMSALMSRWSNAGSCQAVPLLPENLQPGRYAIVQNTTGIPVTLSAWADCTNDGKGDAYLTIYRRPTIPLNDNDRLGCAFVIAEGTNGAGGYASPQSGGSLYCPGLMKANGGGQQLGVCEKAVVHIQPYSMTDASYTPPPIVRVRAE